MILGIDASNVRTGGGFTHLTRLLDVAEPERFGVDAIYVWGNANTLAKLPARPWLFAIHEPLLDKALPYRLYWQWFRLPKLVREGCDFLFAPGGNAPPVDIPTVTMSRNMLPFEYGELFRYGFSLIALRLLLLRFGQRRTFQRADGLIFLTEYAHDEVRKAVDLRKQITVVPHGVEERFRRPPREQRSLSKYSTTDPFRLLYVSIVDVYKHQWHVAEAVNQLHAVGVPVVIDFIGPAYPPALKRFHETLGRLDPNETFMRYRGAIPFDELHDLHENADLVVFASSCENMPNILLESMAAGFPIACARRGPMPEILGDAGAYFDPEDPNDIANAIRGMLLDPEERARCAKQAFERAQQYSWKRCADETFDFIRRLAKSAASKAPER